MQKIIGVSGFISSGKGTVADYLVSQYQFEELSFAASLKDAVSTIFNWDREMLEGKTVESRQWREQIDVWWAQRLDIPHLTPRWILQNWGTDVLRKQFHDDIWIASLQNKIRQIETDIVVTDVRFPNEVAAIKSIGGLVVRVERGAKPDWYDTAIKANFEKDQPSIDYLNTLIHQSEWAIIGQHFDKIFDNNGSLSDLYGQIDNFIADCQGLDPLAAKVELKSEVDIGNFCILFLD
jgi:hypothetical protein